MKITCQDNLELLKSLPDNHLDLIYCDILYGTGRDYGEYKDLKPIRSEIEEHYIPRISEMKRVLKETGSIYLQMDTRINHWIRCIMDDVFGYENFRNEIVWSYKTGGVSKKTFAKKHDVILFYSKGKDFLFNTQYYKSYQAKKYNYNSKYPELFDEDVKKWYHLSVCRDVWDDTQPLGTENKERLGYPTQKPLDLVERIIKASSNEGDLVGDFYLGSGTTGLAAKKLNRNFIGCDINQKAVDLTLQRLGNEIYT